MQFHSQKVKGLKNIISTNLLFKLVHFLSRSLKLLHLLILRIGYKLKFLITLATFC